MPADALELERQRLRDWLSALDEVLEADGPDAASRLLAALERRAARAGAEMPRQWSTPYLNTIPVAAQPRFDGDLELEHRIEALVRWNAMAMVARANREASGIGGHISSYASAGTLLEVGFNHFFRGPDHPEGGDSLFLQGHASPGIYARAFLEGRLSERQLAGFRRELSDAGGLPSYPHPWLMPDFWQFPSVSMGLAPLMAIYQARFDRYLLQRRLIERSGRVWAVVGDGEMDEPESVGALSVAARERLGKLTFVIDCNLQRLDGPVRGNSKIIQELERLFSGAGWRVIKVLWGSEWDALLELDDGGLLAQRMEETVDGEWQRYAAEGGHFFREHFFGAHPELRAMVDSSSDEELGRMRRGGHDVLKLYAAYRAAVREQERPTVILAHTVKGWGLGKAGEAANVSHKTKDLDADDLRHFRDFFELPIPDAQLAELPFYRPADDAPELSYLAERRRALGGFVPRRRVRVPGLGPPADEVFEPLLEGTGERPATTTMLMVRLLSSLLKDEQVGKLVVPIIPDEARTFGVEALFPRVGIYAAEGQRYEPVDASHLLAYRESRRGQLLEEGITEAGSLASAIAAGTAYATHGVNTIPFFFFYSMFGLQRVGDLVWAAADSRTRGFLIGATAGRTTLAGEGLQHQDGHSQLVAYTHPTLRAYDPAFGYELAVIVQDGIRRMYADSEDVLYYVTVYNEPYLHGPMPKGVREGILRGMYAFRRSDEQKKVEKVELLGSGPLLQVALKARDMLAEHGVSANVWSVTSFQQLYRDALSCERHNRLHPEQSVRRPWIAECLGDAPGAVVAVSDWLQALPHTLGQWVPGGITALGTDGFGRSDTREALRDFFEIDARHVTAAALSALSRAYRFSQRRARQVLEELGIDPDKPNPRLETTPWT